MKSAGNRGVVQSCLQMLHVHVFLAAPLGARRVAKSGADQHQGGVPIRERPHNARPPTDLSVQPLDHVAGTDARPVLAGKSAVGQRFLNAVLIHSDRHQNSNIFVLAALVAAQVDAVHVDVWILAALQGAIPPVLDVDVGFLVQFTDGSGRNLAPTVPP
jgi:hypothetical protein